MSYRRSDGTRRNAHKTITTARPGQHSQESTLYDDPVLANPGNVVEKVPGSFNYKTGRRAPNGDRQEGEWVPPLIANPGNVIKCIVGGGVMGSRLAHENEAPFPESLAEFFIRSFCPPGGIVLDPFCGSGTTLAVARRTGRSSIGIDVRESQVALSKRRVAEIQLELV